MTKCLIYSPLRRLGLLLFRSNSAVPSPQCTIPHILLWTPWEFSTPPLMTDPERAGWHTRVGQYVVLQSPGIFPSPRPSLSGFEIFFPFFFFFLAAQVNNLLEISVVHYLCQLFHVLKPHSSADIGGKLSVCVCVRAHARALSCSVMFNFLQPRGLSPARLLCPWDSPVDSPLQYWSGLLFPSPGDLPDPGIEPTSPASPALTGEFFTTASPGKPLCCPFIHPDHCHWHDPSPAQKQHLSR